MSKYECLTNYVIRMIGKIACVCKHNVGSKLNVSMLVKLFAMVLVLCRLLIGSGGKDRREFG